MPGGASRDERRSHPGPYIPKSSRATDSCRGTRYRLAHLLGWKAQGLVAAAGLEVTYRVFRGNDARETPEPPETVQPRSNRATSPSPVRRHRVVDSFDPNYSRSAAGRVRADGPAAAATPLFNSMVGTGCFDSRPASWLDQSPEISSLYTRPRRSVKDLLIFLKEEAARRTRPCAARTRRRGYK